MSIASESTAMQNNIQKRYKDIHETIEVNGSIREHIPVLAETLAEQIKLPPDGIMVDATTGQGGHSILFGKTLGPEGVIVGLDVDKNSIQRAQFILKGLSCKVILVQTNFSRISEEVREQGGLLMVHRGKVYVYPDPKLPDDHTFHADLVEALGWPKSDYDEATRLILNEYGRLAISVGAVGWGRQSRTWFREPDIEVDAKAMRKISRTAKRLIGAGYLPEQRLEYWTASGSYITEKLEDW